MINNEQAQRFAIPRGRHAVKLLDAIDWHGTMGANVTRVEELELR